MQDISRIAFTFKFNWQFILVAVGLILGIVGYSLWKGGKGDGTLFRVGKWEATKSMLLVPAGLLAGILLAVILWGSGVRKSFFEVDIYKYAVMIVTGMVAAIIFAIILGKKKGYSADLFIDVALVCIPLGVLGARIWFVVFPYESGGHDINGILDFFDFRQGGLGIYGGVIGGALGVVIVALWKKINIFRLLDIVAPVVMLAQCIGRWGNFFNQEAYGTLITDPAWQWFPFGVYIFHPEPGQVPGWYHATFFYESMWNLIGFLGLYLFAYKKNKVDGLITCGYFLWYGIGRSWIESLRTDSLMIGSMRVSVVFSIVMIVLSIAGASYFIYHYYKRRMAVTEGGGDDGEPPQPPGDSEE